jgi:hypothetical protein
MEVDLLMMQDLLSDVVEEFCLKAQLEYLRLQLRLQFFISEVFMASLSFSR